MANPKLSAIGLPLGQSAQWVLERMNESGRSGEPFFFALDYELQEGLWLAHPLEAGADLGGIEFRIGRYHTPKRGTELSQPQLRSISPEGEASYQRRFERITRALQRGDSFLANLTIRTPIELDGSLEAVYAHSQAPYKLLIPGRMVCFSPECFVQITGDQIGTHPMKGTIDACRPNAGERLRSDYKESAEHHTIVDLMRNDLNRIAKEVHVARFKYLSHISTNRGQLLQMSSEIVGRLPKDWAHHLGDLIRELLPAGSISGAPKASTCQAIAEAEGRPRGYYTGVCGYFDGQNLDSGVLIRYIEQDDLGHHYYRSGGGITINSQAGEEYAECRQKIYLPCTPN